MWTGDNLDIMRGMNSESVDLIYFDPPFNSNKTYSAPIGSKAAGAAFKDTWTLDDVDLAWHGEIAERSPAVYAVIDAAGVAHGPGMKSYLIFMAVRLLEMQRPVEELWIALPPLRPDCESLSQDVARCHFGLPAIQKRNYLGLPWRWFPAKGLRTTTRCHPSVFKNEPL